MKKNKLLLNLFFFLIISVFVTKNILAAASSAGSSLNLGPIDSPGGWNEEIGSDKSEVPGKTLEKVISAMIGLITTLSSLFFIVQIFRSGLGYVTAGGDSGKIEAAKLRMQQSAVGLGIVVMIYSVLGIISQIVGVEILNPAKSIMDIVSPTTGP
jgi:hypothetical protein